MFPRQLGLVWLGVGFSIIGFIGCGGTAKSTDPQQSNQESSAKDDTDASAPSVAASPSDTSAAPPKLTASPKFVPTKEQLARWNLTEFEPLQLVAYREHEGIGFVSFAAMVQSGQEYLLGGTRLTLWSTKDGSRVHEFIDAKVKENERLLSYAISPDGTWCAVGDAGGLLRKFDIISRKEANSKQTDSNAVVQLAISPDGKEIATIAYVSEISIWDAETLEKKSDFKPDSREIKHLQYVAPGTLLAAGERMSSWDTSTGKKLSDYPSERYQTAIALTPDNKHLVFGSKESLLRWSLSDDKASGEYRGVPTRSAAIRFSDDGSLVAIATNRMVQILDAQQGRQLQVIDASGADVTDICWIPKSQVLMVATDMARNRIWGRTEECRQLGLEPLTAPEFDTIVSGNEPAGVAQNMAVLDLRTLPKLPEAKPQSDDFYTVNYSSASDIDEVKNFYRYVLSQRGWNEVVDQSNQSTLFFSRQGYNLQLSPYSGQPGETYINLTFSGNHDLTKLPQYSQVKATTYSGATSVIYQVEASLLQVEAELLRKFHKDGWTSVVRLLSRQNEDDNSRHLEFVKSGTLVRVMVQPDPADSKLLNVHYSQSLASHSLPVPQDAGLMEWDDSAECQMVANTALSIEDATEFYQTLMPKQGWSDREKGKRIDKDVVYLPFYRGQHEVTVALNKLDGGLVRIRSGKYSDNSWQKPDDEEKSEESAKSEAPDETEGTVAGIEAADMPILHANGAASYDSADGGKIRFLLDKTPLIKVAEDYETALAKLGWTAKPFGDPTEKAVNIHFEKDSNIIYYQSSVDPIGHAIVMIQGDGLTWTKPIGSQKPISYAAWLRNQKLPASLRTLDQFEAEMSKLNND